MGYDAFHEIQWIRGIFDFGCKVYDGVRNSFYFPKNLMCSFMPKYMQEAKDLEEKSNATKGFKLDNVDNSILNEPEHAHERTLLQKIKNEFQELF
jgi:hypothetical protein